jgi:ribosomal protein S18 acetylase RimI-like enzyme
VAASLRSFEARDRKAVVDLSRHALARPSEHVGNPVWGSVEDLERETADWSPPPEETLFVAEEEDQVVGFGGVELPRGFDHAEVFGPLVAPAAQGHRLGTALLEASLELARSAGANAAFEAVGIQNTGGRILLERHGFVARGGPQATYQLRPADHRPLQDPPEGVVIRRAKPEDLHLMLDLYHEGFPEGRFPEAVWVENIERGTVYVAEARGQVVAVLNIDPGDRWIYHVAVAESERNRRVGSYLLSRALEDYWREHPGEILGLDVGADNVPAIRLYRRQGFAPQQVLQTFELRF